MIMTGKHRPTENPADAPASELLKQIEREKARLVKEGKIKKPKDASTIFRRDGHFVERKGKQEQIIDDELPFDIPDTWEWVRLGEVCDIVRGGSPRPIKDFLTENENGINWIKIGDTNKGEKYINSTKEKIIPEGVSKSRFVHVGDFLLTNSMSFGRPYILNIDGCIHDGWLALSGYEKIYSKDFLYYLLSSTFVYYQFCGKASGTGVKNLNIDKVKTSLIPLPPLAEQERIVEKLDVFTELEKELRAEADLRHKQLEHYRDRLITGGE